MTEEAIVYVDGPFDMEAYGRDATVWRWFLNGQLVTVEVSGTAMQCYTPGDGGRLARAIESQGRSEVERMLDWEVPNPTVVLTTENGDEPD